MRGLIDLLEGRPTAEARALVEARGVDPGSDDDLAADAYAIFGRAVFPYAGVFLDDDVGARGPLAEQLADPTPETAAWLPAFTRALRDLRLPLAVAVADLVDALELPAPAPRPELPPPPDPAAPETDVRAIVEHLLRPSRCGAFLSAPVIARVARSVEVPRGFGDRRRMLTELLRSAGRYGRLPEVLDALRETIEAHGPRAAPTAAWLSALRAALM